MDSTKSNSTSYLDSVVDPCVNFVVYLLREVYIQMTTISWTEAPNLPAKPSLVPANPVADTVTTNPVPNTVTTNPFADNDTTNPFAENVNIYFWQIFNILTNVSLLSNPNQQKDTSLTPEIPLVTKPPTPEILLEPGEVPASRFSLGGLWTLLVDLCLNFWFGEVEVEEAALSFAEQKEKRAREWARRAAEKLLRNAEARARLAAVQPLLQEAVCVKEVVEDVEEVPVEAEQGFWDGWGWTVEEEVEPVVGEDHLEYFYMASSLLILYMVGLAILSNIQSAHRRQKLMAKFKLLEADQLFDLNPLNYHLEEPKKDIMTKEAIANIQEQDKDVTTEATPATNSPLLQVRIKPLPDEAKMNLFKSHASQISNTTILEEVTNWQNPKLAQIEEEKKSYNSKQKPLEDMKKSCNTKQKAPDEVKKSHNTKLKPLEEGKKSHNAKLSPLERASKSHTIKLTPLEEVSKSENPEFSHFGDITQSQMLKLAPLEEIKEIDNSPPKPKKPEKKKKHPTVPKKERTKKHKEKDTIFSNEAKIEDKPKPKTVLNFQYDMFDSLDSNYNADLPHNKFPPQSCFIGEGLIIPDTLVEAPDEITEDHIHNDIVEKKKKPGLFNFKEKKQKKQKKVVTLDLDDNNISPMFQGRKMKSET